MLTCSFIGPRREIIPLLAPFTERSEVRVNYKAAPLEVENDRGPGTSSRVVDLWPLFIYPRQDRKIRLLQRKNAAHLDKRCMKKRL